MKNKNVTKTLYMVELAMMVAIIFMMAFTPLGYLRTPGLSITFLTVPVAVGAVLLGPKGGAVCGLAFGLTSFIQGLMGGSALAAMLFSIDPFGMAFTCIVPRILEGWLCGRIFLAARRFAKSSAYLIASLSCPLLNTVLFMSSLVAFFYHTEYIQGFAQSMGVGNPLLFVAAFVGLQGLIEAVVCTLIASAVSCSLAAALQKSGVCVA